MHYLKFSLLHPLLAALLGRAMCSSMKSKMSPHSELPLDWYTCLSVAELCVGLT